MLYYLILCRSLTYAQKTLRILEKAGINASITRLPQGASKDGCAFCVKVTERRVNDAVRALKMSGLTAGRVFEESDSGVREVII